MSEKVFKFVAVNRINNSHTMEENSAEKYLERLQIEGLWGHYDVD